jgi:hypothetical protein
MSDLRRSGKPLAVDSGALVDTSAPIGRQWCTPASCPTYLAGIGGATPHGLGEPVGPVGRGPVFASIWKRHNRLRVVRCLGVRDDPPCEPTAVRALLADNHG